MKAKTLRLLDTLTTKYYAIVRFFKRLHRAYKWVTECIWTNWDFDSHSIYSLLLYKLTQLQRELVNGYCVHNERDLKALRICIKLLKRLDDEYHTDRYSAWHDRKWGELDMQLTPARRATFSRSGIKSIDEAAQEKEECQKMYTKITAWINRDRMLLFKIMTKYMDQWWD